MSHSLVMLVIAPLVVVVGIATTVRLVRFLLAAVLPFMLRLCWRVLQLFCVFVLCACALSLVR